MLLEVSFVQKNTHRSRIANDYLDHLVLVLETNSLIIIEQNINSDCSLWHRLFCGTVLQGLWLQDLRILVLRFGAATILYTPPFSATFPLCYFCLNAKECQGNYGRILMLEPTIGNNLNLQSLVAGPGNCSEPCSKEIRFDNKIPTSSLCPGISRFLT